MRLASLCFKTVNRVSPNPDSPTDSKSKPISEQIRIDDPRVYFASERTLLAWIRTSIAMMGLGFVVAKFGLFVREMLAMRGQDPNNAPRYSLAIGVSMVALGILMTLAAAYEHYRYVKQLDVAHFTTKSRRMMGTGIAILLGLVGTAMALYLVAVN